MLPAEGLRNFVSRLKHVVLPAPFGPIKAWMLPRRTRRSTSRTAKKPANSLVNPRVSRMKSSANQIPPSPMPRPPRMANHCYPQLFAVAIEMVPQEPSPARNMPSTTRLAQGGKLQIGRMPSPEDSPLVQLPAAGIESLAGAPSGSSLGAGQARNNASLDAIQRFHGLILPEADDGSSIAGAERLWNSGGPTSRCSDRSSGGSG